MAARFRFAALLLLAAASFAALDAPPVEAGVYAEDHLYSAARTANDQDSLKEILALEPDALAASAGTATRENDVLLLTLSSGRTVSYPNKPECAEPDNPHCKKYSLIAHLQNLGKFILVHAFYEGSEFIVVDDTSGDENKFESFPYFSQSGQYITCLLFGAYANEFEIQIWKRANYRYSIDWRDSPNLGTGYTEYKIVDWPEDNLIQLQSTIDTSQPPGTVGKQFWLKNRKGRWVVEDSQ